MKKGLSEYVDFSVYSVTTIKNGYGYRVVLKYADGTKKTQQKSGYKSKREAQKARERTIAELYNGEYIVHAGISVKDFMWLWIEEDIRNRTDSDDTYSTFKGIIKNHVVPEIGNKQMSLITPGDIQKLYNKKAEYSNSVVRLVKAVLSIAFRYAEDKKIISHNPTKGVNLPKHSVESKPYHTRMIDTTKTLDMEQIMLLLEKSRETKIHMQVCFNVLMGLRRGEINGVKYSDVDYVNHTLTIERQLGKVLGAKKEDYALKTLTKQEIDVKTESSHRVLPIPDYVFEAIQEERKKYEANRRRRSTTFQDMDYICCSSYGRPRSKNYHWTHYKKLLADCGLPDIRWHDLRSTFCTLLIQNDFSPKAVSRLMGHAREIITLDVYSDKQKLIADCIPEISDYLEEILPKDDDTGAAEDLTDVELDFSDILPDMDKDEGE